MAATNISKLYYGSPIVVILGCTGTGKSKLAIEIAKRFNGEIINADAMQMYKGLDIITNKVTEPEKEGVRHHLLGFLNPLKNLTVCDYKNLAQCTIKDVIDRNKLPIIVGGTFYYVESILYDFVIGTGERSWSREENFSGNAENEEISRKRLKMGEYDELVAEFNKLDNEKLYERLKEVDPEGAEMVHPNCRRKILRSIMVYLQHGETLSSLLKKQQSQPGGCNTGGPLMFTNSFILWLRCDLDILKGRLDKRVDDMLSRGLVNELVEFYKACSVERLVAEKGEKRGIYQSIGFKEFQEFLLLDNEERESEEGKNLLDKGVDLLKLATRQYARQQNKWMLNRFIKNGQRQMPPIYGLDVEDLSKWKENVYDVAEGIVQAYLVGDKPAVEPLPIENKKETNGRIYRCECGVISLGKNQYEIHIKSKKHVKRMKKKRLLEQKKITSIETPKITKTQAE